MRKLNLPKPGAEVAASKPPKPVSTASFHLEGKHAGMPMPKVGDKVAVHAMGKVKSVSMDHYGEESEPTARFSVDANDLQHEPWSTPRKSISDLIANRQHKVGV